MKVRFSGIAAVPLRAALSYRRNWNKNNPAVQIIETFNKGKGSRPSQRYRLYIPIKAAHAKVKPNALVEQAVKAAGFEITDYIAGIAVQRDGKRVMKIGKIIKDERVRQLFANDPERQAHKSEYTCVISCHPYDIIGMSTGRAWDQMSCMRLGAGAETNPANNDGSNGQHHEFVKQDIAQGTLVAYAVKNGDDNIKKPDARVLIKPFINADGQILFRMETRVYGVPVSGFRETVHAWLRKVNANCQAGAYHLLNGLYDDGVGRSYHHLGKLEYADLSNPEEVKEWIAAAGYSAYQKLIMEGEDYEVLNVIKHNEHLFDEGKDERALIDSIFKHEGRKAPFAKEVMEILVPRIVESGDTEFLGLLMSHFFSKFTEYALGTRAMRALRPLLRFDPDREYDMAFRQWAFKINPVFVMNNNDVIVDLDRSLSPDWDFIKVDPYGLNAPKNSNLYDITALFSFENYATCLKNELDPGAWKPIGPVGESRQLIDRIRRKADDIARSHDDRLFVFAANGRDWFGSDYRANLDLYLMEGLTVKGILENPYTKFLFDEGVPDTDRERDNAEGFAEAVVKACQSDSQGAKDNEVRIRELCELLGEHDYNLYRYIEKAIDEAVG